MKPVRPGSGRGFFLEAARVWCGCVHHKITSWICGHRFDFRGYLRKSSAKNNKSNSFWEVAVEIMRLWPKIARCDKLSLPQKMKESSQTLHFLWNVRPAIERRLQNESVVTMPLADYVLPRGNFGKAIGICPIRTTRFSKDEAAIVAS